MTPSVRHQRLYVFVLAAILVCTLLACSTPAVYNESASTIQGHTVAELGRIGALIYRHPDQAPRILQEHQLTPDQFEKAVRTISSSPELSTQYHESFQDTLRDQQSRRIPRDRSAPA